MLRVVVSKSIRLGQDICSKSHSRTLPLPHLQQLQRRWGSYYDSEFEGPADKYTAVEKSYDEWKWVQKLIPPSTVPPAPTDLNVEYPSGWKPQNPPVDCEYFVRRNKNHMVPVYTIIRDRGQIRETRIRHVEGDIWALEKEVGRFLKSLYPYKRIMTYTQECARFVGIRGDYTEEIKEWVMDKGF